MDVDEFWTFLDRSGRGGATRREREAFLRGRLLRVGRSEVLDFVQHLAATREPANTFRLWRAADIIMGGCGTDSFHYFQMWLVGLGRDVYDAAIGEPDTLAAVPAVRRLATLPKPWADEDHPDWETLEYVAVRVGEARSDIDGDVRDVVADERRIVLRFDPDPTDTGWRHLDPAALVERYPRLSALFER